MLVRYPDLFYGKEVEKLTDLDDDAIIRLARKDVLQSETIRPFRFDFNNVIKARIIYLLRKKLSMQQITGILKNTNYEYEHYDVFLVDLNAELGVMFQMNDFDRFKLNKILEQTDEFIIADETILAVSESLQVRYPKAYFLFIPTIKSNILKKMDELDIHNKELKLQKLVS